MANFSKSFNFRNGLQVDDNKLIVKPNTGLVGIGSTIPTQILDVEGNINSSGTVNASNVEVGTGITVGINSSISIDGVSGLITAVSYFGDGSTLTNVVAIATAGFEELSGTLSTTSSVGIGSLNVGGVGITTGKFPDFTLDVIGDMRVTGPSTFIGVTTISDLFANTLSVSNSSSFDDVLVSGVSTFSALTDVNNRLDVVGGANIDQTNVSGVSTFGGAIDANAGADISGGETVLSSATVSDLTDNRIVIAGTSGALEDSGNLTFTGTQLTVTGNAAISGNIDANGNLDVDGQTDLDILNVSETATFSGLIDANNRLDVVGGANIDQLNVTGVSTLTGRLTATEINSASSNVVRLLQSGTQVFNTIGAGVSVSNKLKIGSLNGGTSGLSTHDATLTYGDESGANAFMTRRSLNILNNDTGNFNYFLNINNLKDSGTDRTGDFVWHKASNALMTLTGIGGSLGIGVTTPAVALEVVGGATIGGAVNMSGNVTIGTLNLNNPLNGNLIGNVTGNLTGNLTGNVNSTSGVNNINTLEIKNIIGIGSTGNGGELLFVNPTGLNTGGDGTTHNKLFINDEGRVGVGTTALTGVESNRITVHGDVRIHAGSVLVGNSVVPKSAVDFSDVVNVPDQGGGYSWPVDRSKIAYMIPPKVTTAQRNLMYDGSGNGGLGGGSTVTGALLYNTTLNRLELYDGNGWVGLATVA